MSINDINVCTKPKKFIRRNQSNTCYPEKHVWKVLVFCGDYDPIPGVAICLKCALLEGGFTVDEVIE